MAPDVAADHGVRTEPGATGRTPSGRAHHLGRLARPDAAVPIWRQMVLLQFANLRRRSPRLRKRRARMDANARATDPRRDPGDRGGGDEKV